MNRTISSVVAVGFLGLGSQAHAVNVLVDGSFESNPLTSIANSVGNYPGFQNQWGQENSTIVGVTGGITPAAGSLMMKMDDDGLVATQTTQANDVSAFAAQIDAGLASVFSSALFNVQQSVPAAVATISVHFVDASALHGNATGSDVVGVLNLDANPATWEAASLGAPIPVGTRWILTQVAYSNASLASTAGVVESGYVDAAFTDIRIAPEPMTLATAIAGTGLVVRRRRAMR